MEGLKSKEFEKGLKISKEQAISKTRDSFDILKQYLEHLKSSPELLMSQPFLNRPLLTYSQVNNETTALNLMMAMFREVHFQIIYAAKIRKGQINKALDGFR